MPPSGGCGNIQEYVPDARYTHGQQLLSFFVHGSFTVVVWAYYYRRSKLCLHSSVHLRHFSQYVMRFLSFRKNAHSNFAFSLIFPIFITPFCRPHTSFILSLLGVIFRGFILCKQLLFHLRYIYRQAYSRLIFTCFFFGFLFYCQCPLSILV